MTIMIIYGQILPVRHGDIRQIMMTTLYDPVRTKLNCIRPTGSAYGDLLEVGITSTSSKIWSP